MRQTVCWGGCIDLHVYLVTSHCRVQITFTEASESSTQVDATAVSVPLAKYGAPAALQANSHSVHVCASDILHTFYLTSLPSSSSLSLVMMDYPKLFFRAQQLSIYQHTKKLCIANHLCDYVNFSYHAYRCRLLVGRCIYFQVSVPSTLTQLLYALVTYEA